jgi:hypothetical protein
LRLVKVPWPGFKTYLNQVMAQSVRAGYYRPDI